MKLLYVFLISAIPLIEQRGAIPVGIIVYGLNPILVGVVSFLGSLLPVPFILILFNRVLIWMKKIKQFNWFTKFLENKVQKNAKKVEKYAEAGLITFVGIPIPTTGLWMGSAIGSFLGFDIKKSFWCCALGGIISAVIITVVSAMFPALMK